MMSDCEIVQVGHQNISTVTTIQSSAMQSPDIISLPTKVQTSTSLFLFNRTSQISNNRLLSYRIQENSVNRLSTFCPNNETFVCV